ncbi:hypothetical protein D9M71_435710 [compost metagenome]
MCLGEVEDAFDAVGDVVDDGRALERVRLDQTVQQLPCFIMLAGGDETECQAGRHHAVLQHFAGGQPFDLREAGGLGCLDAVGEDQQ